MMALIPCSLQTFPKMFALWNAGTASETWISKYDSNQLFLLLKVCFMIRKNGCYENYKGVYETI